MDSNKEYLNKATISQKSWDSHMLRVIIVCAGADKVEPKEDSER